jgi:hypothetical protein
MIRNKLYDELEQEGYSFQRVGYNRQYLPEVFSLTDPDDWARINLTVVVNGQHQVEHGPTTNQKTIQMLQRVINELNKPGYADYYSKDLFKDGE